MTNTDTNSKTTIVDETEEEKKLSVRYPQSTPAERRRFLKARNNDLENASEMLKHYLEWMREHSLEKVIDKKDGSTNLDVWNQVCKYALSKIPPTSSSEPITTLPCLVYYPENGSEEVWQTKNGINIFQVLAARIDTTSVDPETYALAVALYLIQITDRESMEQYCVVLDVRSGEGWANPTPYSCFSVMKAVSKLCNDCVPERLESLILLPVPTIAYYVWKMAKPFLDPDTANKIVVESGNAARTAALPKRILNYMDEETLEKIEQNRMSCQSF